MGALREGTQPPRPGRRGGAQPHPRRRRRLHRARRAASTCGWPASPRRPGSPRAWCTTTSPPRSSSSPRCSATPARSPTRSPSRPSSGPGPSRRSGSRPFLDRCLPSDELLTHDWRLWQELDLLCLRQPELAKVGAERLRDHLRDRRRHHRRRHRAAASSTSTPAEARSVAETAVALCDGLGARVVAAGPDLSLDEARTMVATRRRTPGGPSTARSPAPTVTLQEATA